MIKPRIRSIKPEIVTDRKLAQVSRDARLTFIYLWTQSDDDGLQFGVMRTLVGKLYPHDHDVTPELLGVWLAELAKKELIEWLQTNDGTPVIKITKWAKHQRVDKPGKSLLMPMLQDSSDPIRESLAPLTFDLRPSTTDHRPTTVDQLPVASKTEPESPDTQIARIIAAWNGGAQEQGYARVIAIKAERLKHLKARLKENGWFDNAMRAIAYLQSDEWYRQHPDAVRFDTLLQAGKAEFYVEKSSVKRSAGATSRGGARAEVDSGIHEDLERGGGRIEDQIEGAA